MEMENEDNFETQILSLVASTLKSLLEKKSWINVWPKILIENRISYFYTGWHSAVLVGPIVARYLNFLLMAIQHLQTEMYQKF